MYNFTYIQVGAKRKSLQSARLDICKIVHYVEIILQAPRNLFTFGDRLDRTWEWKSPEITSREFLFAFDGASELIPFGARLDLCWNFRAGTLELILFGSRSDRLWDLGSLEITSWGFLLVLLFVRGELHFTLLGVYYSSPFYRNSINHQMTDCLRYPWTSCQICTYVRLKY